MAEERHGDDLGGDQGVPDGADDVVLWRTDQPVRRSHERVPGGPDGDRGIGECEEQREDGPDQPAVDPEVGPTGDGVVGARSGTEQGQRCADEQAQGQSDGAGRDRRAEAEAEGDRQPAEDDHREGQVAPEEDGEQVDRPGVSRRLRDELDPDLFHVAERVGGCWGFGGVAHRGS